MGNKDNATKNFIEKNRIFADVFNFFIYDGEQVIKPDTLQPLDTSEIILNQKLPINKNSLKKYRDIIKQWAIKRDDKATYVLLAVENQSDIHYAMPVRTMLYDALRYSNQIENIANENIKNKKLKTSNEFLSGLLKTDKIMPIMTVIINFSGKIWNAPKTLKQMFHDFDKRFLKFIKDYEINLIDPVAIGKDNFDKFITELREVLLYIKYSKDKVNLYNVVKNDKGFESVPNEAVSLINTLTGSNLEINEMKEESNMCEAIEGIKEDSRKEGEFKALFRLIEEGIITIKQAAKSLKISEKAFKKQLSEYGYVI
jgi:hypothetical protein